MTRHHGHGSTIGVFAIVAAIAFAFGVRTARIIVGAALIGVPLAIVIFLLVFGI